MNAESTYNTKPERHFGVARGSTASVHLDMVRGLAAIAVFVGHVRALFFVTSSDIEHDSVFVQAGYFLTGFGHQAVMVFFVLSGYFISSAILASHRTGRWSSSRYCINRLARLYAVLLPAIALTILWDQVGMGLFGTENVYGGMNVAVVTEGVLHRSSGWVAAGNLLFLQEILCDPLGSNSPLWSLSYEFWYYAMFPLMVGCVWPSRRMHSRAIAFLTTVIIFLFVSPMIRLYFVIWLMGSVVAIVPAPRLRLRLLTWCMAIPAFLCSLILSRLIQGYIACDFFIGVTFAALIYGVLHGGLWEPGHWYRRCADILSGHSYTLYLTHLPMLAFLSAALISGDQRWQPDATHVTYAAGIIVLCALYVSLVWSLTERHHLKLRQALTELILGDDRCRVRAVTDKPDQDRKTPPTAILSPTDESQALSS